MNIAVLDDYQDTIRTLACYSKMAGHQVTIWTDHTKDPDVLAERLKDVEAVTLLRERTPLRAPLLERDARPAVVRDGRAHVGARHRGAAPHPAGDGRVARRPLASLSHWHRAPRQDARHLRLRQNRLGGGGLWQGLRHERHRVGTADHHGEGARRRARPGQEPRDFLLEL